MNQKISSFIRLLFKVSSIFVMLVLSSQTAIAAICEEQVFEESKYIVCSVQVREADLRLFWKGADDQPLRYFSRAAEAVTQQGSKLVFAMNAGMYSTEFSPLGLFIEYGHELQPANIETYKKSGGAIPNFFKKPNGVFYIGEATAGILPTNDFLKSLPKARFATQSGPMLVVKNKTNPIFIKGSSDLTRRSGVGVCSEGIVRFAISEDAVNFHDFARLFRDALKCPNALFLDGGGGAGFYNPDMGRNDSSWHGGYGPMFGLVE